MIDARELRIGNWFKMVTSGKYAQVDLFFFSELHDHDENNDYSYTDYLQPIELTEDILIKCGFEKSNDRFGGFLSPSFDDNQIRILKDEISCFWHNHYIVRVPYLHQLQNLYYCLTQKELEIKYI